MAVGVRVVNYFQHFGSRPTCDSGPDLRIDALQLEADQKGLARSHRPCGASDRGAPVFSKANHPAMPRIAAGDLDEQRFGCGSRSSREDEARQQHEREQGEQHGRSGHQEPDKLRIRDAAVDDSRVVKFRPALSQE